MAGVRGVSRCADRRTHQALGSEARGRRHRHVTAVFLFATNRPRRSRCEKGMPQMTRTISTDDLRRRLGDPGLTIVDLRPIAAYNGWALAGEPRGGHIPGAVAFPAAWLDSIDEAEIVRLLDEKRVTPD